MPPVTGDLVDRRPPALPLEAAGGATISLDAFHGKVVVLAPVPTLCHEVCPLTTGAFHADAARGRPGGFGGRVAFVEVSVDPWRDTPRGFARSPA